MSVGRRLEASDSANEHTSTGNEMEEDRAEGGPAGSSEEEWNGQASDAGRSKCMYERLFDDCIWIPPSDAATPPVSSPSTLAPLPLDREPLQALLSHYLAEGLIVETGITDKIEMAVKALEMAPLLDEWIFDIEWPSHEVIRSLDPGEQRIKAIFISDEAIKVDDYACAAEASMYHHTWVCGDDMVRVLARYLKLAFKAPQEVQEGCGSSKHPDDELWLCWDLVFYYLSDLK